MSKDKFPPRPPIEPKPLLCINCKHHLVIATENWCGSNHSLVTGQPARVRCEEMRQFGGPCGFPGKLFSPR